ncbi:hypothetical protein NDU88_006649 [Pleurodeles waltl]|uniref:Uncharacterized protein n=1 Tax=Pleurodeles waltl TaxID=8319 RepID=A0AAV7N032_PLEWA|nr:hypothetical protein NDU88_006649 [Pleurodeles waltl]
MRHRVRRDVLPALFKCLRLPDRVAEKWSPAAGETDAAKRIVWRVVLPALFKCPRPPDWVAGKWSPAACETDAAKHVFKFLSIFEKLCG